MSSKKIFQILFACLIGAMAELKFSAASYAFLLPEASTKNSIISLFSQNSENQGRPWWKWWERERKSGGSRGELVNQEYCSISPSVKNTYVFSSRPLFVFFSENRSVQKVEVYSLSSQEPLWSHAVSEEYEQQQPIAIEYNGPELEAGQKYEYVIRKMYDGEPASVDERIASFQLISTEAQSQIQNALDQINAAYTNSSNEELVWAYIDYFSSIDYSTGEITAASEDGEEGLFLDAVQQLFLLDSLGRTPHLQNIYETYCKIESEDS